MTKQLKPACEFRQFGKTVIVKFKGEKKQYNYTADKEVRDKIKTLVEQFNKQETAARKEKLINLLTAKSQKAELVSKAEKKKADNRIKELERELAEEKAKNKSLSETLQLAENAGADQPVEVEKAVATASKVAQPEAKMGIRRPGEW